MLGFFIVQPPLKVTSNRGLINFDDMASVRQYACGNVIVHCVLYSDWQYNDILNNLSL